MYDFDLSLKIANKIHALPKNCYWNTKAAFLRYRKLRAGLYIEGYAVVPLGNSYQKLPFEHAWIELEDGSIVDPTYAILGFKNVDYIPGIKLSYGKFTVWRKEKKQFPFFYNLDFLALGIRILSMPEKRHFWLRGYEEQLYHRYTCFTKAFILLS